MGDRAMAEIKTQGGSLYVYSHWDGFDLPERSKEAIRVAKPRWDDYPYGTRIIVDQLTKEGRDKETGLGLMLAPDAEDQYNNDEPSVIIDLLKRTFTTKRNGQETSIPFLDC